MRKAALLVLSVHAASKILTHVLTDCRSVFDSTIVASETECDDDNIAYDLSIPSIAHKLNQGLAKCSIHRAVLSSAAEDSNAISASLTQWRKLDPCLGDSCALFACLPKPHPSTSEETTDQCVLEPHGIARIYFRDLISRYVLSEDLCTDIYLFEILYGLGDADLDPQNHLARLRARLFDLACTSLPSQIQKCGVSKFCRNYVILRLPLLETERIEATFGYGKLVTDAQLVIHLLNLHKTLLSIPMDLSDLSKDTQDTTLGLIRKEDVADKYSPLISRYKNMITGKGLAKLDPIFLRPLDNSVTEQNAHFATIVNLDNALRTFPSVFMGSKVLLSSVDKVLRNPAEPCGTKRALQNIVTAEAHGRKFFSQFSASDTKAAASAVSRPRDYMVSAYLESGFPYLDTEACNGRVVEQPSKKDLTKVSRTIVGVKSQYRALYDIDRDRYNADKWSPIYQARFNVNSFDTLIFILSAIHTYCPPDNLTRWSFVAHTVSLTSSVIINTPNYSDSELAARMSRLRDFWARLQIGDEKSEGKISIFGLIARGLTALRELGEIELSKPVTDAYFQTLYDLLLQRLHTTGCRTISRNAASISERSWLHMMWAEEIKYSARRGTLTKSDCILLPKALAATAESIYFAGTILAIANPWVDCVKKYPSTITPLMDATFEFLMMQSLKSASTKSNSPLGRGGAVSIGIRNLLVPRNEQNKQLLQNTIPRFWALGFDKERCFRPDYSGLSGAYEVGLYSQMREVLPLSEGFCADCEDFASLINPQNEDSPRESDSFKSVCDNYINSARPTNLSSKRLSHIFSDYLATDVSAPVENNRLNLNQLGALVSSKLRALPSRLNLLCRLLERGPAFAEVISPWVYLKTGRILIDRRDGNTQYRRWDKIFPRNMEYIDWPQDRLIDPEIQGDFSFNNAAFTYVYGMSDVAEAFDKISEDEIDNVCCTLLQLIQFSTQEVVNQTHPEVKARHRDGRVLDLKAETLDDNDFTSLFFHGILEYKKRSGAIDLQIVLNIPTEKITEISRKCQSAGRYDVLDIKPTPTGLEVKVALDESVMQSYSNAINYLISRTDAPDAFLRELFQSHELCNTVMADHPPPLLWKTNHPMISLECKETLLMLQRELRQQLDSLSVVEGSFVKSYIREIENVIINYIVGWPFSSEPCSDKHFRERSDFLLHLAREAVRQSTATAEEFREKIMEQFGELRDVEVMRQLNELNEVFNKAGQKPEKILLMNRIPVYLNRAQEGNIETLLAQYPLRPLYRPYGDHGRLVSIERGVQSGKLKITYALNTGGPHFDEGKKVMLDNLLEQKRASGKNLGPEEELMLEKLRFHKLKSTESMSGQCDYAVGIMHKGRFFVTPISKLLQLQPDFCYVDQEDQMQEKAQSGTKGQRNRETMDDGETDGAEKQTKLTQQQQLQQQEEDLLGSVINSRLKTLTPAQLRRREAKEQYQPIDAFFDADSPESADIVKLLTTFPIKYRHEKTTVEDSASAGLNDLLGIAPAAPTEEAEVKKPQYEIRIKRIFKADAIPKILLSNDVDRYYSTICAGCALSTLAGTVSELTPESTTGAGVGVGPLSFLALSRLSIDQQVKRIMSIRQIENFADIKQLITSSATSDADLIEHLKAVAIPIHGVWVATSEIALQNDEASSARFYELEVMTRDVIICLFVKNRPVDRMQLRKMTQLPPDRLNRILSGIYNIVDGKFVAKVPPDPEFEKAYPTMCKAAEEEWSPKRAAEVMKKIAELNANENAKRASLQSGGSSAKIIDTLDPNRVRTLIANCLGRYGASAEDFVLNQVKTSLQRDIEREIGEQLEGESSSITKTKLLEQHNAMIDALKNMQAPDIRFVLAQCATHHEGLWVLNKTGNQAIDPYRALLLSLYRANLELGVTKADFKEACVTKLKRHCDLPDVQYRTIFKEVAVNLNGRWYFKGSKTVQDRQNEDDQADD